MKYILAPLSPAELSQLKRPQALPFPELGKGPDLSPRSDSGSPAPPSAFPSVRHKPPVPVRKEAKPVRDARGTPSNRVPTYSGPM